MQIFVCVEKFFFSCLVGVHILYETLLRIRTNTTKSTLVPPVHDNHCGILEAHFSH